MGEAKEPTRDHPSAPGDLSRAEQEAVRLQVFRDYQAAKLAGAPCEAPTLALDEQAADPPAATTGRATAPAARTKLFSEIPHIEGKRIVLDRVVDADAEALRDLIESAHAQRFLPTYLFESQFSNPHEAIHQMYGKIFRNKESLILAVRPRETGELAGLVEFYGLVDHLHKVSVGVRLREPWWWQGIAAEAISLMIDYLYGSTDIEIITASTMVANHGATRVCEKAGFICVSHGAEEDWGFPEPAIVNKWFV